MEIFFIIFRSIFQSHQKRFRNCWKRGLPCASRRPSLDTSRPQMAKASRAAVVCCPVFPFFPLQQVWLNTTLLRDRPCFPTALRNKVQSPPPSAKALTIRPLPLCTQLRPPGSIYPKGLRSHAFRRLEPSSPLSFPGDDTSLFKEGT